MSSTIPGFMLLLGQQVARLLPRRWGRPLRRYLQDTRALQTADVAFVSFPKSGRTWVRVMVSRLYQTHFGIEGSEILEFDNLHKRDPRIPRILFTHDGEPWRRPDQLLADKRRFRNTKLVLLVRNPIDVIVSRFFHVRNRARYIPFKQYARMSMLEFLWAPLGGMATIVGFFHDWDRAVKAHGDALVVRYEDFRRDPTTTLATLAKFLQIGSTTEEIEEAVAFASFENLRKLEEKKTLATARLGARAEGNKDSFKVRRGKVGGYADYFQPEEVQRLDSFVHSQLNVSWTDDVSAESADPPVSVGATGQPVPGISVILPTHNRSAILGRAIDSVLSQTHADFELLIVDDGSTDGTDEVVRGYTDPRIIYLPQTDHVGAAGARNVGARQARGSIVCFLDSDDAYRPNKLEFVAAYFAANPDRDALIDSYVLRGSATDPNAETLRLTPRIDHNEDLKHALYSRRMSKPTSAIGVRRAALLAVGCFDETMARRQDVDLILRLTRHHRCATTDEVLWTKYWNEGALSTTRSTFIDATIDLCQRHPEYLRTRRYSIGLGRDLVRHTVRLARAGQWRPLVSDLGRFGAYRGYAGTAGLMARGAMEIGRRFVASR